MFQGYFRAIRAAAAILQSLMDLRPFKHRLFIPVGAAAIIQIAALHHKFHEITYRNTYPSVYDTIHGSSLVLIKRGACCSYSDPQAA